MSFEFWHSVCLIQDQRIPLDLRQTETGNMNVVNLAEIGSWIAVNGKSLLHHLPQVIEAAKEYWVAANCRSSRWALALKTFSRDLDLDPSDPDFHDPWPAMEVVIEEILISELLTKVWAAMLVSYETQNGSDEVRGLAHGVHLAHMEARNRAIRQMLKGRSVNEEAFDRLNRLRNRIERWTDLYLAQLPPIEEVEAFAFDRSRVADYRSETDFLAPDEQRLKQQLLSASMCSDLCDVSTGQSANPPLNGQIASGVMACFSADRFDADGLPRSARSAWLDKNRDEASFFIDKLIELDSVSSN